MAALVAYLASPAADSVNGQVFVVYGPMVALMAAPVVERRFDAVDGRWTPGALAEELGTYFEDRDPAAMFSASAALRELADPRPAGRGIDTTRVCVSFPQVMRPRWAILKATEQLRSGAG